MMSNARKKNTLIKKKDLKYFFEILKKYQQWLQTFESNETKYVLLQYKSWDHEIPLKLNTKLTFESFWFLFEKNLK